MSLATENIEDEKICVAKTLAELKFPLPWTLNVFYYTVTSCGHNSYICHVMIRSIIPYTTITPCASPLFLYNIYNIYIYNIHIQTMIICMIQTCMYTTLSPSAYPQDSGAA